MAEALMTRGEVSRLLGVSAKTLSAWERDGKVPPPARDWRGWRGYTREQVAGIREKLAARGRAVPDAALNISMGAPADMDAPMEMLSARNRLKGRIVKLEIEGLMAEVTLALPDGQHILAVITRSSVQSLGLREGDEAVAVIKSTEVMVGR